jgi:hypothetical protein
MRKLMTALAATVAAGSVFIATGAAVDVPVSYQGVAPIRVDGNPDCKDINGWVDQNRTYSTQLKFVAPVNGTSGAGLNVTVAPNSPVGTGIGWYVTPALADRLDVRAVIVKGGPSANVYFYPAHPATGDFVDGSMTTPGTLQKGSLKFAALSYMEFCYFPERYVPPGA